MTDSHEAPTGAEDNGIPGWMFGLAVGGALAVGILSFVFSSGQTALINIILGLLAIGALWILWVSPSKARHFQLKEGLIGLSLLAVGAMIGSSPPWYPSFGRAWVKSGLVTTKNDVDPPTSEMYTVAGRIITPTDKVGADFQLLVVIGSANHGVYIPPKGLEIPKGIERVEIFLQNRKTGEVSGSIPIVFPPAAPTI